MRGAEIFRGYVLELLDDGRLLVSGEYETTSPFRTASNPHDLPVRVGTKVAGYWSESREDYVVNMSEADEIEAAL